MIGAPEPGFESKETDTFPTLPSSPRQEKDLGRIVTLVSWEKSINSACKSNVPTKAPITIGRTLHIHSKVNFFIQMRCRTLETAGRRGNERARTYRTPNRGTAKRLPQEYARPGQSWRVPGRS